MWVFEGVLDFEKHFDEFVFFTYDDDESNYRVCLINAGVSDWGKV